MDLCDIKKANVASDPGKIKPWRSNPNPAASFPTRQARPIGSYPRGANGGRSSSESPVALFLPPCCPPTAPWIRCMPCDASASALQNALRSAGPAPTPGRSFFAKQSGGKPPGLGGSPRCRGERPLALALSMNAPLLDGCMDIIPAMLSSDRRSRFLPTNLFISFFPLLSPTGGLWGTPCPLCSEGGTPLMRCALYEVHACAHQFRIGAGMRYIGE